MRLRVRWHAKLSSQTPRTQLPTEGTPTLGGLFLGTGLRGAEVNIGTRSRYGQKGEVIILLFPWKGRRWMTSSSTGLLLSFAGRLYFPPLLLSSSPLHTSRTPPSSTLLPLPSLIVIYDYRRSLHFLFIASPPLIVALGKNVPFTSYAHS